MRKKQVWRYYCEFCKKAGCSAGHMARHERGCTANPNRVCGVCRETGVRSKPLHELIALCNARKTAGESWNGDPDECSWYLDDAAIKALRELANSCPVCMLAALRQSGAYAAHGSFDLKKELAEVWSEHNEAKMQQEHAYV